ETGLEHFRMKLGVPVSFAAQCWHDGMSYIPGNGSHLLAVHPNGQQHWHYQTEGTEWLDKTPVVAGDCVLTSSSKGSVIALNIVDGKPVWQTAVGQTRRQLSPPVTNGQRVFVGARDGLYALDVRNGQQIWSFPTERSVTAHPSLHDDIIYMTSHDHHIYALDASTGQELWRYQMDRYIELSPVVSKSEDGQNLTIYVIDRGGKIAALQHQSSQTVSSGVVSRIKTENIAEKIKQLEDEGEITLAAEAWFEAGELERAAEQFELADKWQRAADLWKKTGRYLKFAQALEGYANSIEDEEREDEERVMAWRDAAKAYEAEGEKAKAEFCLLQVSKYEEQPVLDLSIEHDGLVQNVWSKLKLTIFNNGYGPARRVDIYISGEQFAGQVASSKYYFKLLRGEELFVILAVRPLQYGDSVPMKITLEYQDNKAQMRQLVKTIFVSVAPKRAERVVGQIQNVFATTTMSAKMVKNISNITDNDLVELRRNLAAYFNINELRDLCFELNIDDEELIDDRKSEFAREIILYLKRRGRLQDLISFCLRTRPHISW
ncbi:MAG: PQQ-like beta-propeller repeat protein, partial [Anaerolineae bacterium]|nr:PQQ-like beta-propeller repeat protein [Anaerolineae bacterium]